MKIAILGTRGIPNYYGGFEQFAEFFSVFLADKGHEVYVYNSHNHPYQDKTYKGVHILHHNDPEHKVGTVGQFVYDYNCIMDSRKRNFDIILQLGYTSNSVWYFLLPKKTFIITNMDGMEWKRTKYSSTTRKMLAIAEKLAVQSSNCLISDSLGIQKYLKEKYNKESAYIAYGATVFTNPEAAVLQQYDVQQENYQMIIARFEPENNLEMILDGSVACKVKKTILVIGNHKTKYGEFLKNRYSRQSHIRFIGALYNLEHLNNLRYFSSLYFHGHTVGGTNPSLLEAMASGALIAAHNNEFNRGILKSNAFYFSSASEVAELMNTIEKNPNLHLIQNNFRAIEEEFNWDKINDKYLKLFEECLSGSKTGNPRK
jgi:glycosyltransferase involved in cell wall biosynthesis